MKGNSLIKYLEANPMILKMTELPFKWVTMPFFNIANKIHMPLNCSEGILA